MVNWGNFEICVNNWFYTNCQQISPNIPDYRQAEEVLEDINGKEVYGLRMTPQEELFAKFYNHEKILVKDMDKIQLQEHREELQKIAFEAKARLVAADDESRERKAKSSVKEKDWTTTDSRQPYDVSSAINVVKTRAARMSKMDKMRKQLTDSGIDEVTVNEMIKAMEKRATDSTLKTITFSKQTTEISAIQVKPVEKPEEPKEPFNPASLKFS